MLVEVPRHDIARLGGDRWLEDQRRLERADLAGLRQPGRHGADQGLAEDLSQALVLIVDLVFVPRSVAVGRLPVGEPLRPHRQGAIPLAGVVPRARRDQLVDLVVGEQLLAQVPAVLGVKLDIVIRRQQGVFLVRQHEGSCDAHQSCSPVGSGQTLLGSAVLRISASSRSLAAYSAGMLLVPKVRAPCRSISSMKYVRRMCVDLAKIWYI